MKPTSEAAGRRSGPPRSALVYLYMFIWLCRATCSSVSTSMFGVSHAIQNEKKLWIICDVLKDVVSRDIVQPLASVQRPEQKYWLPHPVPLFTAVSMIPNMCHWSGIRAWHNTRHFSRTILSCLFFTRSSRFFTHIGFLLQTCIRLRLCLERVLICSLFTAIVGRGGC